MPVPQELLGKTERNDEIKARNKHICWKIKGQAAKIAYRLFAKYGDIEFVEEKPD